jgi:hypothetical protein
MTYNSRGDSISAMDGIKRTDFTINGYAVFEKECFKLDPNPPPNATPYILYTINLYQGCSGKLLIRPVRRF